MSQLACDEQSSVPNSFAEPMSKPGSPASMVTEHIELEANYNQDQDRDEGRVSESGQVEEEAEEQNTYMHAGSGSRMGSQPPTVWGQGEALDGPAVAGAEHGGRGKGWEGASVSATDPDVGTKRIQVHRENICRRVLENGCRGCGIMGMRLQGP